MAIKIPRNLHVAAILFLGALMLIGFLVKGLTQPDRDKPAQKVEAEPAPDQTALIAEIRKQNEAALEAERKLREKELAIERAKRELEQRERDLSKRPADSIIAKAPGEQPKTDDKAQERREAAAMSKIVAMRSKDDFGIGGVNLPVNGSTKPAGAGGQSGVESSFEDRYRSIREALGPQPQDDRSDNERWQDRAASADPDKGAVKASPARRGTVVHEGTSIRAVLLSRINSDLPGMITARVLSDIYDTQTGLKLAIPAGSRLVGQYNSNVAQGQRRVMAAFHRIILPDGRSLYLKAANGTDNQGTSGLAGSVDTHFWEMLGSQLLVATVAWAMEPDSGSSDGTTVNVYSGGGSGNDLSAHGEILVDAAKKLAKPYENRKPTITLEPGATFNVMVNQDLLLAGGN